MNESELLRESINTILSDASMIDCYLKHPPESNHLFAVKIRMRANYIKKQCDAMIACADRLSSYTEATADEFLGTHRN